MALVAIALIGGCNFGPSSSHYVAVLDELRPPAEWHLGGTKIHSPDSGADYPCSPIGNPGCPSVDRYFFVDGDPKQILDGAEKSVVAAGFTVTLELRAACDGAPNGPLCAFRATRASDTIFASLYRRPSDAGVPDDPAHQLTLVIAASH
jgi:hypothetical protein